MSAVESFIAANGLDERAAEAFRTCGPQVQQAVMERGGLEGTMNPSSAFMVRLKQAQGGGGGGGFGGFGGFNAGNSAPANPQAVETFIAENGIDEKAAEALRTAAPGAQQSVLSRGSLLNAQNPSSALMCRLRDAQKGSGGFDGMGFGNQSFNGGQSVQNVEMFVAQNGIDEKAAEALRTAAPGAQQSVLSRGSLLNAQNPSSALMCRLRDAQKGGGGKGGGGFGGGGGGGGGMPDMKAMQDMMAGMMQMMGGGGGGYGSAKGFGKGQQGGGFGGGCAGPYGKGAGW